MKVCHFSQFLWVIFALLDPDPGGQNQCGFMRVRIHTTLPKAMQDPCICKLKITRPSLALSAIFAINPLQNYIVVPTISLTGMGG